MSIHKSTYIYIHNIFKGDTSIYQGNQWGMQATRISTTQTISSIKRVTNLRADLPMGSRGPNIKSLPPVYWKASPIEVLRGGSVHLGIHYPMKCVFSSQWWAGKSSNQIGISEKFLHQIATENLDDRDVMSTVFCSKLTSATWWWWDDRGDALDFVPHTRGDSATAAVSGGSFLCPNVSHHLTIGDMSSPRNICEMVMWNKSRNRDVYQPLPFASLSTFFRF